MSTASVARGASTRAKKGPDGALRHHLECNLRDLWDAWTTPVWVADARGEIVYANRTARSRLDGPGREQAAVQIARAMQARCPAVTPADEAGAPVIDVSPLISGHGERVGWLAVAAITSPDPAAAPARGR